MENYEKFEGIDYVNNFAKRINSVHQLVSKNLRQYIHEGSKIIDVGGGPAVGAKIIDAFGGKVEVLNLEPSANVKETPEFENVKYQSLQLSFVESLSEKIPFKANVVLMVSSAHEIALAYSKTNRENKSLFFSDLEKFLVSNTIEDALFCIGFPNYKPNVSEIEIAKQREFVDCLLGHSHPPQENFYIEDFENAFNVKPVLFEQKPMVLADETEEETKLMANFAAFKVKDIIGKR